MLPNDLDLDFMFGDGVDASVVLDPPATPCDTALSSAHPPFQLPPSQRITRLQAVIWTPQSSASTGRPTMRDEMTMHCQE